MAKNREKVINPYLLALLPFIILICLLGYLYKEHYFKCITVDFSQCISSKKYTSTAHEFSFRYPANYPLSYETEAGLTAKYGERKCSEWVNFSNEFYLNAGGERLGTIIVYKNTQYKDVHEYANKELSAFKIPPTIAYKKISGHESVCSSLRQQPHTFMTPNDSCVIIYRGKLYDINFDYNSYYHKQPLKYYQKSRELIFSTFTFD
jgi:hypothetical protein